MIRINEDYQEGPQDERSDVAAKFEANLRANLEGKLEPHEIERYISYAVDGHIETIEDNIDFNYLKLKRDSPERAEQMIAEVDVLHDNGIETEEDIIKLCKLFVKYMPMAEVRYKGWLYKAMYPGSVSKFEIKDDEV